MISLQLTEATFIGDEARRYTNDLLVAAKRLADYLETPFEVTDVSLCTFVNYQITEQDKDAFADLLREVTKRG